MDTAHRHGHFVHSHLHAGKHRHLALLLRPSEPVEAAPDSHDHDGHAHDEDGHHGHSHGLVDPSIVRSRSGIRAVSWSLAILTGTALAQTFIYSQTLSAALLADLIHNFGDALTAIPLGIAFYLRSARGERWAGLAVVLGYFTAGSARDPMSTIMERPYGIPAFARHLNAFTTEARGSVLQKRGEQNRYFYRFTNPLLQPFSILTGLAKGQITDEKLAALETAAEPSSATPSAPEPLF